MDTAVDGQAGKVLADARKKAKYSPVARLGLLVLQAIILVSLLNPKQLQVYRYVHSESYGAQP